MASTDQIRLHVTRSRAKPGGTAADAEGTVPFRRARKPPWLKVPAPGGPNYRRLKEKIGSDNLHTVCEEANCPNVGECWERGTVSTLWLKTSGRSWITFASGISWPRKSGVSTSTLQPGACIRIERIVPTKALAP